MAWPLWLPAPARTSAAGARDLPGPLDTPLVRPGELDDALAPQVDVVLDVPGRLADLLRIAGDEVVRQALVSGWNIRRGPGYSVRLVAPLALHRAVLEQSAAAADSAGPAERKAHRVYAARVAAVQVTRLHGA
ncbi:hypothetical protein [Microtetraspora malaysiensis]|uniref:hypothetical protein n=1 Tax=Microtetraspora malaysiensis TaxID=161358 RepID=UPI003D8B057D